ncbi:MAG TPA: hypothetical protein VGB37_04500 [Candidatus Lokiarchaeia archaeon]
MIKSKEIKIIEKREYDKLYRIKNLDKIKKYSSIWQKENKEKLKIYRSKIKIQLYNKEYSKKWREKNKVLKKKIDREYQIKNKDILNRKQVLRKQTDINYKIKCNLRNRIYNVLKRNQKYSSLIDILGCSVSELKQHLESQFKEGMDWNNYGKWEIDHILPCAEFDLKNSEEQEFCFHYTNLQPLWKKENASKKAKIFV